MSTLKSIFKKQFSWPAVSRTFEENNKLTENREIDAIRKLNKSVSLHNDKSDGSLLRNRGNRRHNRSSLGVLEDTIKCPICKETLQSPRLLACQHTFCKKCLEVELEKSRQSKEKVLRCPVCKVTTSENLTPELLPINESIESVLRAMRRSFVRESEKPSSHEDRRCLVVDFSSLRRSNSERGPSRTFGCARCGIARDDADPCPRCQQVFCKLCGPKHTSQLKSQLQSMISELERSEFDLNHKLFELNKGADKAKDLIAKNYDMKIASLIEEKKMKLTFVEEWRLKSAKLTEKTKQQIVESQAELIAAMLDDFSSEKTTVAKK